MATRARGAGWVLIVGDRATARVELFRALERAGLHATVVESTGAVELLRQDRFDLVLLDAESEAEHSNAFEAIETEAGAQSTAVYRINASGSSSRPVIPSFE